LNPRFKDYFHFSSIERKGILALFLIMAIILVANQALYYFQDDFEVNHELAEKVAAEIEAKQDSLTGVETKNKSSFAKVAEDKEIESQTAELFDFDPNGLSIKKWQKLGLSQEQAEVIKNYEASGGEFRVKGDVEKMYTISTERYQKLEPFILLPNKLEKRKEEKQAYESTANRKNYKRKWETIIVDINSADSVALQEVYGLGPFFSGRIVKLREELGGFHSKQQLLEIWNFSDSLLEALDSNLVLEPIPLKKLNINQATAKELKQHRYIDWNIANSIVNIREQHGHYETLEDLKQSVLINDSLLNRLKPYFKL
jgi:competence ComEA-like helix-hairpin-helix protein